MSLPEREGGGGAPTFFVWWWCACAEKVEREPETDPQGTVGLGCSIGVPLRGTPICFFISTIVLFYAVHPLLDDVCEYEYNDCCAE